MGKSKPAKLKYQRLEKSIFSPFRGNPNSLVNQPQTAGHGPVISISIDEYANENSILDSFKQEQDITTNEHHQESKKENEIDTELPAVLSTEELKQKIQQGSDVDLLKIWENRLHLIDNREDASLLLSALRFSQGVDSEYKGASYYLGHELVECFPISKGIGLQEHPDLSEEILGKKRTVAEIVLREGQQKFRKDLMMNYGAKCMVTGEKIDCVLDAAHISPYDGKRSNSISNGLILRTDIHRMFDANLIGINPAGFLISLNYSLSGSSYAYLEGKKILVSSEKFIDLDKLNSRWESFLKCQNNQKKPGTD